jgi:hypothetical protein
MDIWKGNKPSVQYGSPCVSIPENSEGLKLGCVVVVAFVTRRRRFLLSITTVPIGTVYMHPDNHLTLLVELMESSQRGAESAPPRQESGDEVPGNRAVIMVEVLTKPPPTELNPTLIVHQNWGTFYS